MLHGLRAGAPLYVLYKSEPKMETLEVVSVSNPVPQFPTYTAGIPSAQPQRIIDIHARRGDETVKFEKVPADVPIADFGPTSGIVLAESKEAIFAEVDALQKESRRKLAEVPHLERVVKECDRIKQENDPALQKEMRNTQRLDTLEQRIEGLTSGMASLEGIMSEVRTLLKSGGKKPKDD